jgi:hypothetical protein
MFNAEGGKLSNREISRYVVPLSRAVSLQNFINKFLAAILLNSALPRASEIGVKSLSISGIAHCRRLTLLFHFA